LGFHFSDKPNVSEHVNALIKKTRRRYWTLRHLRTFGFDENELVAVYKSLVRSVIEYCSVVYHSMLTSEQSIKIERLQLQALKCIYGIDISYAKMLAKSGLERLDSRRTAACRKFALKCVASDRFSNWFPLNEDVRRTRKTKTYREDFARCDRLRNSPIYYMRRLLNDS
jgi:hypothetical protein